MKTLIFYGSSDDLLELDGDIQDEFGAYGGTSIRIAASDGEMLVVAVYPPKKACAPVWGIGVAPVDEDKPLPAWPTKFRTATNGYSAALVIECPDDVRIVEAGHGTD